MAHLNRVSIRKRLAVRAEAIFMSLLVPKKRVGPFYRILFKGPLVLQRLGLGALIPQNVLILTTRGRRSGRLRQTPMEFSRGSGKDVYLVMSGWDGNTDWYKNARANPRVRVWLAGREWDAAAEPVPDTEVARLLKEVTEVDPSAARMFSRWSDVPVDGTDASFLAASRHFPSLYLRPVNAEAA